VGEGESGGGGPGASHTHLAFKVGLVGGSNL